MKKTNNPNQLC